MTARRQAMEKLLADGDGTAAAPAPHARAGAVRSMGLALDRLHAGQAPEDGGERVVELDPALCDPSFVRDRLEEAAGEDIDDLARSIADGGQAVPILVRPSPVASGRYQIAYGHRRWRACQRLGRPVRAVVREMGDDALVLAQGHENNARRDLTFIERAAFADALVARGVGRTVIGKALGVDKSELARLLQVASGLPKGLAAAIGRAPKAGRPRWLKLVALCQALGPETAFAATEAARERSSDARFTAVLDTLSTLAAPPPEPEVPVPASVTATRRRVTVVIDEAAAPGFGPFLAERLQGLFREFRERR